MVDFLVLLRDWGKETGVTVSVGHLCGLMNRSGITFQVVNYKSDSELLKAASEIEARVLMLQVPTFEKETFEKLIQLGKETTLVIHSTISFLQVEESGFHRVIDYLSLKHSNFSLCNPSRTEVAGFSAYAPAPVFYLPNTFNPSFFMGTALGLGENVSNQFDEVIHAQILDRAQQAPAKVSLFCEYRPFKNMMTQITAMALASKKLNLELHLLKPTQKNEIVGFAERITTLSSYNTVWHESRDNQKLRELVAKMAIGMQVSYSETFSYILFEHMIQGIPTIGSTTVPYSSQIPHFNDPVQISESIVALLEDRNQYIQYSHDALVTAKRIKQENDNDALVTLRELLRRATRWQ